MFAEVVESFRRFGRSHEVPTRPGLARHRERLSSGGPGALVDNALHHNVKGGAIWITANTEDDRASLTIANTGPEIPAEAVGRLLQPFQRGSEGGDAYRTRPRSGPDAGLGLGLSIVAAIAAAHDADLTVTPRLTGGGLTIRLSFPRLPAAPLRPAPEVTRPRDDRPKAMSVQDVSPT